MTKRYFPVSARNWTLLEQVRLVYDGQVATFNGSRGIYSPAEYSFHCQSVSSTRYPLLVPNNVTDNTPTIQFTDFQVEYKRHCTHLHTQTHILTIEGNVNLQIYLPGEQPHTCVRLSETVNSMFPSCC